MPNDVIFPFLGVFLPITIIGIIVWDYLFGDDYALFGIKLPHPVVVMGKLIIFCEKKLYYEHHHHITKLCFGALLVFIIAAISALLGLLIDYIAYILPYGMYISIIINIILGGWLIAAYSLHHYADAVYQALKKSDITQARQLLPCLCGRDPSQLESDGIARGTIESLGENLSDAVTAPLFYYACFGLAGILAYKAINSCDSMIGYKSARYYYFGRAAAKCDDWVNFIPARMTALLLLCAGVITEKSSPIKIIKDILKYAKNHESPNAGYPESAMASALNIALGGPRYYQEVGDNIIWIGDPKKSDDITINSINNALKIYRYAVYIILVISVVFTGFYV